MVACGQAGVVTATFLVQGAQVGGPHQGLRGDRGSCTKWCRIGQPGGGWRRKEWES